MRPIDPVNSAGTTTGGFTAATGLAALETVADFAVFFVEGKRKV
jgi:hypothetical protein